MSLECRDRMSNEESHSEIFANQVVRTYNELNHTAPMKSAQSILNGAATTVNYAPMLSVLFLGTRMRALQLSGNPAFLLYSQCKNGISMQAQLVQCSLIRGRMHFIDISWQEPLGTAEARFGRIWTMIRCRW